MDFIFNAALGRIAQKIADGATLRCLLLKGAGSDAVLRDLDTIAAVLAEASTTEADFTNYARQTLGSVQITVDDAADGVEATAASIAFPNAGGAVNNTCVKAIIYEEVTDDSDSVPLTAHDVNFTTNGQTVTLTIPSNGWWGSVQAA